MKKVIGLFVLFLSLCIMTGCGPSLKEYVAKSANYNTSVVNNTTVSVDIQANNVVSEGRGVFGAIGSAINTASAISSAAISYDQTNRLQQLVDTQTVTTNVGQGFADNFAGTTHLQITNDNNPDLRINLQVKKFGLWAESLASPIKFYIECDAQIVYSPEMKTIYKDKIVLQEEISNIFTELAKNANFSVSVEVEGSVDRTTMNAISDTGNLINGAANLTAFFNMTDEEIVQTFNYMGYAAGKYISDRLTNEIYR